ncbi:hypothetical protein HDU81_005791 [Chytriomyces hyalinus]|nr:hypothetical protein HDU81_005791 [Chytriomyces hyalinus]
MSAALAIAALQTVRIACLAVSRIPPKLVNKARKRDIFMMIAAFVGSEALTSAFVVPVTLLSWYYGRPPGTFLIAVQYVFYGAQVYGLFESFAAKGPAVRSLQAFDRSLQTAKVKPPHDAASSISKALEHPDTKISFFLSALAGYFWVPRNVEVIRDIPYVSPQEVVDSRCTDNRSRKWLMLDIIRQKEHCGRPVLVYIHGGAWSHGDKRKRTMPTCYHFASHENWVVLNIK